jgi:hypothetical protein
MNLVFEKGEVVVTLEDVEKNVTLGIVEEIITFFNALILC